nr:hypothetical protein [Tanacetum cinerariifolium]
MGRNLDNKSGKFLMYPRFIQVFFDKQLEGLSNHERKYVAPSHTKKIFENMRRVGKGFSENITPLFATMVVQNSIGEAVYKELDDRLVRVATTASSLEGEQDSGNINKTQSKETPNESSSQGTDSGGGPRCQNNIGDTIAQTRSERMSKLSNDSLLARGNTLQSDEDELKLNELMELCTTLQSRGLDLEKTKTTQALEIYSLKRMDASKLGRKIHDIDADEDITLVNDQDDKQMFDVNDLQGEEVFVLEDVADKEVNAAGEVNVANIATTDNVTATMTVDEVTLAQALMEIKSTKPKAKGIVLQELSESTTTTTTISLKKSQDKGKTIMIEEHIKLKNKDQIMLDEKVALKLQAEIQAEFDKEQRLASEKAQEEEEEANIALIETWDDVQAKINADYQLAKRLEDVKTLWKLVKAKHGSTKPEGDYERVLWGDLKVMFKPHIEDEVWKMQQRYNVVRWTLFNSCGVHCLSMQSGHIYMLVEKRYPLIPAIITDMLNKKLHADYFDEMTYQLLKLITKQLKNQ